MATFNLKIVTPNFTSVIEKIDSLHLTTICGDITILPEHYPLKTGVDITKVKIVRNRLPIYAFASEGVMFVREKETTLLINAFEFKDDIDIDRAKASLERATTRLKNKGDMIDISRAEASLKRAMTSISIVEEMK